MTSAELLLYAQRLQAIAQAGLSFRNSPHDVERYEEVRAISIALLQQLTDEPFEKIVRVFAEQEGIETPKIDVRAVLFDHEGRLLLVKERLDAERWSLPGGLAEVGHSPFETAVKEAKEETGLEVRAVRLLALLDKRKHAHPAHPWHIYKAFVRCEIEGGRLAQETSETAGARWFGADEIAALELSIERVTHAQLAAMFAFAKNPDLRALCD